MRSCLTMILISSLAVIAAPGCNQSLADRSVQITAEPTAEDGQAGAAGSSMAAAGESSGKAQRAKSHTASAGAASLRDTTIDPASAAEDDASMDVLLESMEGVDPAIRDLARRQILAARNLRRVGDLPGSSSTGGGSLSTAQTAGSSPSAAATEAAVRATADSPSAGASLADVGDVASAAAMESPAADASAAPAEPAVQQASASRQAVADANVEKAIASEPAAQDNLPPNPFELAEQLIESLEAEQIDPTAPVGYQKLVMLRTLYALTERVDEAAEPVEGLELVEQQFLQNQMLALATVATPSNSPVRSRRYVQGLPHLRQAVSHLAAATGSLELKSLQFCTDVEDFAIVKPFESNEFKAGQEVLLYCEIENFAAEETSDGYETHFQGTYELFNSAGERLFHQVLPADQQTCNRFRRDYFIAYHMYLPQRLAPGAHRLRLTIEDLKGKKYGQADVEFEIVE